jgi:hypothetical protein
VHQLIPFHLLDREILGSSVFFFAWNNSILFIFQLEEEIPSGGVNSISAEAAPMGIPVVVMCFTRASELNRTLSSIFST